MKILILQLARLGDIYQTWPVLRALKRTHPGAELHFLTRSSFASAAPGKEVVDRHWKLDAKHLLLPLIDEKPDIKTSLERLSSVTADLCAEDFQTVINLSFSPFSSCLAKELQKHNGCEVKGYTRTDDDFLSIPDDGSAYFYAQAGIGRANRIHVTDLFAFIAGVELHDADWIMPEADHLMAKSAVVREAGHNPIVIHVGASDLGKTLTWTKWMQVSRGLLGGQEHPIVLVGSNAERDVADAICASFGPEQKKPVNLVGKTNLNELFEIIRGASLVIGGDSAPVHIASLTHTKVLNISLPMVNFWETGPRSEGSRIFPVESTQAANPEEIVTEALAQLDNRSTVYPIVRVIGPSYPYVELRPHDQAFEWEMLRAIYMNADFPASPHEMFDLGIRRLADVVVLAREQITTLKANPHNSTASAILDRAVEIVAKIEQMVPELAPLIRWFNTEMLRIGPMPLGELMDATDSVYERLGQVMDLYLPAGQSVSQGLQQGDNDDVHVG